MLSEHSQWDISHYPGWFPPFFKTSISIKMPPKWWFLFCFFSVLLAEWYSSWFQTNPGFNQVFFKQFKQNLFSSSGWWPATRWHFKHKTFSLFLRQAILQVFLLSSSGQSITSLLSGLLLVKSSRQQHLSWDISICQNLPSGFSSPSRTSSIVSQTSPAPAFSMVVHLNTSSGTPTHR